MNVLIVYEFIQDSPKYSYTVIEHESIESAIEVFKHQNPWLKVIAARELTKDSIYL